MRYTREEILNECTAAFQNISTFYKKPFVNYRGRTSDTNELFTEVVAEFLCDHIAEFTSGIAAITRKSTYKTPGHDGEIKNSRSNREEEIIAMSMYDKQYDFVGKMIDYQTPLKNERLDEAGKIDLLAYDGTTLRILELKKPDSTETMLRCVLEGYTYLQTVDRTKLLADFGLPKNTVMKACPFVFRNGEQHREMLEERPMLKRIMDLLDSKPYYISEINGKYVVTED